MIIIFKPFYWAKFVTIIAIIGVVGSILLMACVRKIEIPLVILALLEAVLWLIYHNKFKIEMEWNDQDIRIRNESKNEKNIAWEEISFVYYDCDYGRRPWLILSKNELNDFERFVKVNFNLCLAVEKNGVIAFPIPYYIKGCEDFLDYVSERYGIMF